MDEIKELAHKLNIQTYSAFLVTSDSAITMRLQWAASGYCVIYEIALKLQRDTSIAKTRKHRPSNQTIERYWLHFRRFHRKGQIRQI